MLSDWLRKQLAESGFDIEMSLPALLGGLLFIAILAGGIAADILLLMRRRSDSDSWAQAVRRLRERPWTLQDVAFVTLALATWITSAWWLQQNAEPGRANSVLIGIGSFLTVFLTVAVYSACAIRSKKTTWRHAFGMNRESFGRQCRAGGFLYLAFMPPFVLIGWLYAMALKGFNLQTDRQKILRVFIDPNLPLGSRIAIVVMAVIMAPIWEETLFRGIASSALAKQARLWLVVGVVSLFFAAIHGHLPALLPLFTLAVALSLAYIHTGSLVVPIVMHAIFNSVTLTFALLFKDVI